MAGIRPPPCSLSADAFEALKAIPGIDANGPHSGVAIRAVSPRTSERRVIAASVRRPEGGAEAVTGLTALQGIVDHLEIQRDETVMIFGASGAVGTLAVQFGMAAVMTSDATVSSYGATCLVSMSIREPGVPGTGRWLVCHTRRGSDSISVEGLDNHWMSRAVYVRSRSATNRKNAGSSRRLWR